MWCEHIQTVFRVSPGPDSGPGQRRRTRARPGTSSRSHGQINLSLFSAQPRSDAQPLAEARGAEHRSSAPVRPLVKFTLLTCAPLQRHTELSSVSSSALAAPCGTSVHVLQRAKWECTTGVDQSRRVNQWTVLDEALHLYERKITKICTTGNPPSRLSLGRNLLYRLLQPIYKNPFSWRVAALSTLKNGSNAEDKLHYTVV